MSGLGAHEQAGSGGVQTPYGTPYAQMPYGGHYHTTSADDEAAAAGYYFPQRGSPLTPTASGGYVAPATPNSASRFRKSGGSPADGAAAGARGRAGSLTFADAPPPPPTRSLDPMSAAEGVAGSGGAELWGGGGGGGFGGAVSTATAEVRSWTVC